MKKCANCAKELDENLDFWPNRKICKICYHNKYQRKNCETCGLEMSHTTKYCKICKYKDGKFCNGCKKTLPAKENFGWKTGKYTKYRARCKECEAKDARELSLRRKNSEKYEEYKNKRSIKSKEDRKNNPIKAKIKSTKRTLTKMILNEDINYLINKVLELKKCECCGEQFETSRDKHIDHCHSTNKYRGIICRSCNHALGHVKDDINRLNFLIDYLKKFKE